MRLFDWLVGLYPRRIRDRFGPGMRVALAEEYAGARGRGRLAAARFVVATVVQTAVAAGAERLPRLATLRSFASADLRDAVRSLRATPVVTTVAVLSLTLGIGANTALFSILYSLVLKPLPVAEPDRLAVLAGDWTNPIWEEIRDRQNELFDSACAWSRERFNLAPAGRVDPVDGGYVSGGLFHTLGITTPLGRPILPSDDVRGGAGSGHVAVVSHRFWQQRLGARAEALGRTLTVNGVPFTIVGVAPAGFFGPEVGHRMDLFLPLSAEAAIRGAESALDGRSSWWLQVMVRLRPDQTIQAATAALDAARRSIRDATMPQDAPAERRERYLQDEFTLAAGATGVSSLRTRFAQPLTVIMAVVGAVLLIACANIANLMLARAAARRHEMSIRLALGASRMRLGGQVLVESLLLAVAGGVAGLALAHAGSVLLVTQLGSDPSALNLVIDGRILGFTGAIALAATLLFGLAPALRLSTVAPNDALKDGTRAVRGDRRFGVRSALVVAQIALSFVLIAAAGLFLRTFATLMTNPLGFDPERLLIVNVDARQSGVDVERQIEFYQRVSEAVSTTPGVTRAALSFLTPMSGRGWNSRVQVVDAPPLPSREQVTWLNAVAPGWFDTYGMRILAGRDFNTNDGAGGERVGVVNESFARRFFGASNPVGRRVRGIGGSPLRETLIVGVVNDAVYRSARAGFVPTMYVPMTQGGPFGATFSVTARTALDDHSPQASIAAAVNRVDPALTVAFRDYSDQIRATVVQERLVALLSAFFGALAVLLAALGLYGVTSYAVNRRRPELALRMALGASRLAVVRLVLARVSMLLVLGTAIGLAVTFWAGAFVGSLLFGLGARDPLTLTGAGALLVSVGLFAGWLPARSVSRLDPTTALRE